MGEQQTQRVVWVNGHGRFLKALAEHGNVCRACRELKQRRQTVYAWIDADPAFAAAVNAARDVGMRGMYDSAVDHIYRAIESEDSSITPESVRISIKILGSLRPNIWGDKSISAVELSGPGGGPITSRLEVSFVRPDKNPPD